MSRHAVTLTTLEAKSVHEVFTVNGWFADWLAMPKKAAFYRVRRKVSKAVKRIK